MARYAYNGQFVDQAGNAVSSGTVSVYLAGTTTAASVYTASSGGTAVNSVTSDSTGKFLFYVDTGDYAANQYFKIVLSKSGFLSQTYDNIVIFPTVTLATLTDTINEGSTGVGVTVEGVLIKDNLVQYATTINDSSSDTTAMQTTVDPYPAAVASLATSQAGENHRLRYLIKQITGEAQWYIDPDNTIAALELQTAGIDNSSNFKNLVVKNNATNPNYQVDIDADIARLLTTAGIPYKASSVDETADITASGVNGLDTGSEAVSTWYHIWIIYNGTAVNSLLSASATAPTMPTGYTYKVYAGAIYNGSDGHFIKIYQMGSKVARAALQVLTNGVAVTATAISLVTVIPTTAKNVGGYAYPTYVSANSNITLMAVVATVELGNQIIGTSTNGVDCVGNWNLPIISNEIYYKGFDAGANHNVFVTGWEY